MTGEKKYYLSFSAFPGIGPLRFKALLSYFGSAQQAWGASRSELINIGLGYKLTSQFNKFRQEFSFEKHFDNLKRKKIRVLTLLDKKYPELLKEISDPPFVLYFRGDLGSISDFSQTIAVVGTRKMTAYGNEAAEKLVSGLVDAGLTIVSGMAYGIDAVAHKTAIETGGRTIAVLGGGVDVIYPASNTMLYWQIVKEAGLVMSEYPFGFLPSRQTFPLRNRIISGLSLGVVVVEGAEKSGTLITAKYAAQQGREVFAVPGQITSKTSGATTILLKEGAKFVTRVEDILEELRFEQRTKNKKQKTKIKDQNLRLKISLTKEEKKIVDLLENESLHFDDIVRCSGIEARRLGGILSLMEIKGFIKNLGQGAYGMSQFRERV